MKEYKMEVEGMSCGGCEKRIENIIQKISGVDKVEADYKKGTVIIKSKDSVTEKEIKEKIEKIGFNIKG